MTTTLDNMTARGLDALQPPATGTDTYRDGKTRGLELRVSSRGRKTWVFRYSVTREGTRHFPELTLGTFPALSLADARDQAQTAQRALHKAQDPTVALGMPHPPASARAPVVPPQGLPVPAETRALLGLAPDALVLPDSFGALAASYLTHFAKPNKVSWQDDAKNLRSYLLPYWRDLPVASITRKMVHDRVDAIAERGSESAWVLAQRAKARAVGRDPQPRPAPVMANRIVALISKLFSFALDRTWVDHHPAIRIGKREETPRTRWLSRDEVLAVWTACEQDPDPICAAALLLQLFTGQRGTMIVQAEWPEFDIPNPDHAWWTVPRARVKNRKGDHRVPLGPLSVRLLGELRAASYHRRYLFPHRGVGLRAPAFFTALYDVLEAARMPLTSAALAQALATRVTLPPRRAAVTLRISCELSRRAKEADPFVVRTPAGWALTDRTLRPVLGDGPLTLRTTSWRDFTARVTRQVGFFPHDLRRTMTTHLGRLKVHSEYRGKLLSHTKPRDITSRVYDQYEYDDEKMAAMRTWHEELARWRGLPEGTGRVVNFPRG